MRRLLVPAIVAVTLSLTLLAGSSASQPHGDRSAEPKAATRVALATSHPRRLITPADLPRLRSWASASNPIWAGALVLIARRAKRDMDKGRVPGGDLGSYAYETYPTELYAELAFMSMIHPNAAQRRDFGKRARKLLMALIRKAAPGRKANTPFRDPVFSVGDRSRYYGEAFGLTVDWAYRFFSRSDKKLIRKVFQRWAKEQYRGYPLDQFRGQMPSPQGQSFDPALISDPIRVRWSLNNYYIGHARNLGLMAMALDRRDDPGEALRSHLNRVVGQWLFVINKALTDYAPGGLSPEGFEYGADSFGRLAQLITAMRTAGASGWETIAANPAWDKVIESDLLSLPYSPTRLGQGFESLTATSSSRLPSATRRRPGCSTRSASWPRSRSTPRAVATPPRSRRSAGSRPTCPGAARASSSTG